VHDIDDFERRGVPAIFVASEPFRNAAITQSAGLGFEATGIYIAHPIQDRTDNEMFELADGVIQELLASLTGSATEH